MGLEEFNVAPDNKGGRPEKTEEEQNGREAIGLTMEKYNSQEYWKSLLQQSWNGSEITVEAMSEMTEETVLLPHTVISKLMEHEIVDQSELGEYLDMYRRKQSTGSSTSSTERSDSGGLSSIIDAAK